MQQKTRRQRPAGLPSDVLAGLDLLKSLGLDYGPELCHLALIVGVDDHHLLRSLGSANLLRQHRKALAQQPTAQDQPRAA